MFNSVQNEISGRVCARMIGTVSNRLRYIAWNQLSDYARQQIQYWVWDLVWVRVWVPILEQLRNQVYLPEIFDHYV